MAACAGNYKGRGMALLLSKCGPVTTTTYTNKLTHPPRFARHPPSKASVSQSLVEMPGCPREQE